jgi:hypothetical protein
MLYGNRISNVHLVIGAFLALFVLAITAGPVMAESASDYGPLFDIKSQFNPNSLTENNGQYLLAYPVNSPPNIVPPGLFRVFIPAGTVRVDLLFFAAQSSLVAMVGRYNMPPQCDYSQINAAYWDCYPWDRDGTGTLSGMSGADMRFRNSGGHGYIMKQVLGSSLSAGGWVYIKILGSGVYHFQYNVYVDAAAYSNWYATGTVPDASGTVSGSCTFEPISGCSPSAPPTNNNNNSGGSTNPLDIFFHTGTQNNNSSNNSNTLGDLFSSLFGGGTFHPGTGSNTRLDIEIDTTVNGSGDVKVVTDADLADYSSVILKPSLKFDGLTSGEVDCFAMIVANQAPFLIDRETLFNGPAWMMYGGRDRIYRYGAETLETTDGSGTWACRAFDFLATLNLPPSVFTENRLQFIFAIAPVGEFDMGKYENLRFGVVSFQPDQTTEPPPADQGTETPAPTDVAP